MDNNENMINNDQNGNMNQNGGMDQNQNIAPNAYMNQNANTYQDMSNTAELPTVYKTWFIILSIFITMWPLAIYLFMRKKKYTTGEDTKLPGTGFYILYGIGVLLTLFVYMLRMTNSL